MGIITVASEELIATSNILDVVEGFIIEDLAQGYDEYLFDPNFVGQAGVAPAAITVGADNQVSAGVNLAAVMTTSGTFEPNCPRRVIPV